MTSSSSLAFEIHSDLFDFPPLPSLLSAFAIPLTYLSIHRLSACGQPYATATKKIPMQIQAFCCEAEALAHLSPGAETLPYLSLLFPWQPTESVFSPSPDHRRVAGHEVQEPEGSTSQPQRFLVRGCLVQQCVVMSCRVIRDQIDVG